MKIMLLCCVLMFPVLAGAAVPGGDVLEMAPGPDEPVQSALPYDGEPAVDGGITTVAEKTEPPTPG